MPDATRNGAVGAAPFALVEGVRRRLGSWTPRRDVMTCVAVRGERAPIPNR
jgi:hypothetical protein